MRSERVERHQNVFADFLDVHKKMR
jgi:hypothetical protein